MILINIPLIFPMSLKRKIGFLMSSDSEDQAETYQKTKLVKEQILSPILSKRLAWYKETVNKLHSFSSNSISSDPVVHGSNPSEEPELDEDSNDSDTFELFACRNSTKPKVQLRKSQSSEESESDVERSSGCGEDVVHGEVGNLGREECESKSDVERNSGSGEDDIVYGEVGKLGREVAVWNQDFPGCFIARASSSNTIFGLIDITGKTIRPFEEVTSPEPMIIWVIKGEVMLVTNFSNSLTTEKEALKSVSYNTGDVMIIPSRSRFSLENHTKLLVSLGFSNYNIVN